MAYFSGFGPLPKNLNFTIFLFLENLLPSMKSPIWVDAKQFWEIMCKPAFWRTSLLSGVIGDQIYMTLEAPEHIMTFRELTDAISRDLNLDKLDDAYLG